MNLEDFLKDELPEDRPKLIINRKENPKSKGREELEEKQKPKITD